jgi:predicted ATP-grasp superfamily ATP-dependent carboligase
MALSREAKRVVKRVVEVAETDLRHPDLAIGSELVELIALVTNKDVTARELNGIAAAIRTVARGLEEAIRREKSKTK